MGNVNDINTVQTPKGWMLRIKQGAQFLNAILYGDDIQSKDVFMPKAWHYRSHENVFSDATCDTDTTAGSGTSFGSNPKIIQMDDTSSIRVNMPIRGAGIPEGTYVEQIDSSTLFRIAHDVNATANNQTLYFNPLIYLPNFITSTNILGITFMINLGADNLHCWAWDTPSADGTSNTNQCEVSYDPSEHAIVIRNLQTANLTSGASNKQHRLTVFFK